MSEPILEMKNISMNFGGVHALKHVDFQLKKGEVHALMGENGAGKSTLMKVLLGIYQPTEGKIFLHGEEVHFKSAGDSLKAGISMIHQEFNPITDMTVAENMYLGREPMKRVLGIPVVDFKTMYHDAKDFYESIDLNLSPKKMMGELTVAHTQLAEIAKAISYNSDIIIMDEPTSALSDTEVKKLFKTIELLRTRNVTIVYISHKLDEVYAICDSVTVLRDGEYVGRGLLADIDRNRLISMMVGREIKEMFAKLDAKIGEPMLEVKNLCAEGVSDVSFTLHRGEILGIAGLMGAGRTEMAEALYGARPKTSGEIRINGKVVKIESPQDSIRNRMVMVPEDRKNHGAVQILSILDNIIMSRIDKCQNGLFISRKKEQNSSREMVEKLKIKVANVKNPVNELSGGNQQKVVIAKALFAEPDIIILDEPTRGIDVMTKAEIHQLMSRLAQEGKAVLVISSEMEEILEMSDRILVLKGGRIRGELLREEATQEKIMQYAF